jgi:hypothetical protein
VVMREEELHSLKGGRWKGDKLYIDGTAVGAVPLVCKRV